jgi:beta-glucosidase/6-phospho-beta-glucosidase/beta-galactosidase
VGLNYYTRWTVRAAPSGLNGIPGFAADAAWATGSHEKTDTNWDIYPVGFYDIVTRMSKLVNMADRQQRTIKDSGHWYAKVAAANRVL